MSVTAPPRPPGPPRPSDPIEREELEALVEALIEEARQRQRRRRRIYLAVAAFVGLAAIAIVTVIDQTAGSQNASPAFAATSGPAAVPSKSRISFFAAVPNARVPKGLGWQAELYVVNPDGSGMRRLVRNAHNFAAPVWSGDGLNLAFERRLDRNAFGGQCGGCNIEIYVANADGTGQRNLSRSLGEDLTPEWSPDGQRIAFISSRDSTAGAGPPKFNVYVINADGSGLHRLTQDPNPYYPRPAWSPDGRRIAFESARDGNLEIYLMNADGSVQQNLTRNREVDVHPAWSPDGQRIAFISHRAGHQALYVMNADGSGQRKLARTSPRYPSAAWSPDGRRIAFVAQRNGEDEIYVINANGAGLRNLTRTPGRDGQPAWSPDGRTIGFVSSRGGNRDIYVMNADGSRQRNLTRGLDRRAFGIAWSPAQK